MIFKSLVFSQASGSTGGLTYSRNAGGMYVRSRALPTNPNSPAQQAVRDSLRIITDAWTNVLGSAQREGWNTYGFNTPTLNALGEMTIKTGQQMYVRSNVSRLQAGLARIDDAPGVFDLGSFTPVEDILADDSDQEISIPFTVGDEWVNVTGSAMLVYCSRPVNHTRTFHKGPYQLLTAILGNGVLAPTSPATANALFPMEEGQKLFFKINVTLLDGRYTNPQEPTAIVVA